MLCCGYNAGPSKVNAARMKGTIIIDEESFVHFIETGEIPDAKNLLLQVLVLKFMCP
jgi:BRCT domain type II-containing protein